MEKSGKRWKRSGANILSIAKFNSRIFEVLQSRGT